MGDFFYDPETVTVDPGDTITWTNVGEAPEGHTVTGEGFDSGVVEEGERYSHRFDGPGTFPYICSLHDNMTGTVVVGAAGGGGGGGGGGRGTGDGSGEDAAGTDGGGAGDGDAAAAGAGGSGSGGSGSGTTGGSSAGAGQGPGSANDDFDGPLAYTGLNLVLLFEVGVGLLASGYLARRLLQA
jgi:hypothetical protein